MPVVGNIVMLLSIAVDHAFVEIEDDFQFTILSLSGTIFTLISVFYVLTVFWIVFYKIIFAAVAVFGTKPSRRRQEIIHGSVVLLILSGFEIVFNQVADEREVFNRDIISVDGVETAVLERLHLSDRSIHTHGEARCFFFALQ